MKKILIEMSARHIHVNAEQLEILYGKGHELTPKKMLSQPGQFLSEEKVTVCGPKGELKVSILGPCRKDTQLELSFTDARALGLTVPVRESGDIKGSASVTVKGPAGEYTVDEGAIAAMRHVHLDPATAEEYGLKDKQIVSVKYDSGNRKLIFGDVVVRVSPNYAPAMHIDTDEANAAGIAGTAEGEIIC
ncbi:MAG: phosphate propanoyltransferase [Clostridia bacterium]|nr:phosphate propanoyltransferase [Clostridia bacterium]